VLYDKLSGIAELADWRLMIVASAVGVFVFAAVLIWNRGQVWKRIRVIETKVSKMQNEITTLLQIQTALITKLNTNSRVEIVPRGRTVEIAGGDVAEQTMSPPVAPAQPDSVKSGKNGET
jgi:hypothetical protein